MTSSDARPPPGAAARSPEPPGRLRWRCRRGMRELDMLLTRFLETEFPAAAPDIQAAFRDLLDCQDPLIHAYCTGREPPPTPVLRILIERITRGAGNER